MRARAAALLSLAAFYGCYALVAGRAARGGISLGDMTLYLAVFRQGQGAVPGHPLARSAAMYEDALFMSNLFAYLHIPTGGEAPRRACRPLSPPRGRPAAIELAQRLVPLPRQGGLGAARRVPHARSRARSSGWWARTARARARW